MENENEKADFPSIMEIGSFGLFVLWHLTWSGLIFPILGIFCLFLSWFAGLLGYHTFYLDLIGIVSLGGGCP
jgi:hypothetical protein